MQAPKSKSQLRNVHTLHRKMPMLRLCATSFTFKIINLTFCLRGWCLHLTITALPTPWKLSAFWDWELDILHMYIVYFCILGHDLFSSLINLANTLRLLTPDTSHISCWILSQVGSLLLMKKQHTHEHKTEINGQFLPDLKLLTHALTRMKT